MGLTLNQSDTESSNKDSYNECCSADAINPENDIGDWNTKSNGRNIEADSFDKNLKKIHALSLSHKVRTCIRKTGTGWKILTQTVRNALKIGVVSLSMTAAKNPKTCAASTTILSIILLVTGYFTNFDLNLDQNEIFAPYGSPPVKSSDWIYYESNFPESPKVFSYLVDAQGANVISEEGIRRCFEVLDVIRNLPDYGKHCDTSKTLDHSCRILSITGYWNDNLKNFDDFVQSGASIVDRISQTTFPNGQPVELSWIAGKAKKDEKGKLVFAQSFPSYITFPDIDETTELEKEAISETLDMGEKWEADRTNDFRLEIFSDRSWQDEFGRAIFKDYPLLPLAFMVMSGFASLYFFKRDRIESRSMLGIGSILTIVTSVMAGYGLMFIIGVPFTSMTQMVPFLILGVGLDDTFIITGEYFRTDQRKSSIERIKDTMESVGVSIVMTTVTTSFAFMLGCTSNVPAIYWLCLYLFPTLMIDFLFQITTFVALIVLDERRIHAIKLDKRLCNDIPNNSSFDDEVIEQDKLKDRVYHNENKHIADRFMKWYANNLLRPCVKAIVIIFFVAYFGFSAYRMTLLTQEFDFTTLVPKDSYVTPYFDKLEKYTERLFSVSVYFRDVDQSDENVQQQMKDYLNDLGELEFFSNNTSLCWIRDFSDIMDDFGNITFNTKIDTLLTVPEINAAYGRYIVRDEYGNITASRCNMWLSNLDFNIIDDQIDALAQQREVTAAQPINKGRTDHAFFTYDNIYFLWEFYNAAIEELISTTITGLLAVSAIGLFFMPHWSGVLFILPTVVMLYVDVLGTIQLAGVHINAVSYVVLVISIGLLVDFIMHFLFRFYESSCKERSERVKDALETMGSSILVGGLSTFLGVVPLYFSTSEIFSIVYTTFLAMVILGVAHGLIFLPVVLSMCGPDNIEGDCDSHNSTDGSTDEDGSISSAQNYNTGLQGIANENRDEDTAYTQGSIKHVCECEERDGIGSMQRKSAEEMTLPAIVYNRSFRGNSSVDDALQVKSQTETSKKSKRYLLSESIQNLWNERISIYDVESYLTNTSDVHSALSRDSELLPETGSNLSQESIVSKNQKEGTKKIVEQGNIYPNDPYDFGVEIIYRKK